MGFSGLIRSFTRWGWTPPKKKHVHVWNDWAVGQNMIGKRTVIGLWRECIECKKREFKPTKQ